MEAGALIVLHSFENWGISSGYFPILAGAYSVMYHV